MLTGPEKAVLFLLSLREEVAAPIVNELTESDLRKLRAVASTMREVPTGALDEAFREFVQRASTAVAIPRGGLPYLRRLSVGSLGEQRASEVFEDGVTSPLSKLEHAPPDALGALLANEPPQLAAAVLARLEPQTAASVLAAMPIERQTLVLGHVSRMTELPAKVLEDVAAALANDLPTSDAATLISIDGIGKAAEMLNAAGRETANGILAGLEAEDKDTAALVRQAMFSFEDMRKLDARAMREVLREVSSERLTVALKGASPELLEAVFAGLSARAAELVKDDLEILGKVKKSEIEASRREIIDVVLRLEGEGKIDTGRDDG